jgi:hypothetical protein
MSDPTPAQSPPPASSRSIGLGRWERWAAAGAGIVILTVASVAELWAKQDGLGTVAFAVVGAACLLLGLVGRMPTRLSLKDYATMEWMEMEKQQTQAAVEELVEELPASAKKEIVKKADDDPARFDATLEILSKLITEDRGTRAIRMAQKPPDMSKADFMWRAASESLAFEENVRSVITPIFAKLGFSMLAEPQGVPVDFIAQRPDRNVYIVVRRTPRSLSPVLKQIRELRNLLLNMGGRDRAILIVSDEAVASDARGIAVAESGVLVLFSGEDSGMQEALIENFLSRP